MTNTGTNVSTPLTTNISGYYEAPLLPGGQYQVTVEAPGFEETLRSNLVLTMSDQIRIDIKLEVGAVNESITITAESPILDTSTTTTGKALTTREIMDLPVMTNDLVLLARVAAGVVNQGTTFSTSRRAWWVAAPAFFRRSGLARTNGPSTARRTSAPAALPSRRLPTRYRCLRSRRQDFDATFGHAIGLNIAFSTESGTNNLHGSGTEQYWNTHWNAAPFFVKQKYFQGIDAANASGNSALASQLRSQPMQPGGHSNDYGATLGGPIYIPKVINGKNKLFFFFSFSQNKTRQPARSSEITSTVPTMPERTGDFSDLLSINSKYQIYDPLSVANDSAPGRALHQDADSG